MSDKKFVSRNVAVGLGVVAIVLAAILAMVLIAPSLFGLGPKTTEKPAPANLVNVGLGASDLVLQYPYTRSLRVSGYVINTGSSPAYNARLHVVAYFAAGAKAIDTEIVLGSGIISGLTFVEVNEDIPYSAGYEIAASSAPLTPVWSATP